MKSHVFFLICGSFVTFAFILQPARGGTTPIQKGGADLEEGNDRDRGIGPKRTCQNCTTTESPYPFPAIGAQSDFRIKPGKNMPVDEQFDDDYYKDYDFEFAKSGHDSPNFEKLIRANQKDSYEFNSIEEMDAQAEFPAHFRKLYCSGNSPYDMEMLCNTIDALLLGENIENEEHREQVVKYKRWY